MEEPEVHMHPGAIRQCARAILAAVRRGIQIVLSTHSLELIDALLSRESFRTRTWTELSLYRLPASRRRPEILAPARPRCRFFADDD